MTLSIGAAVTLVIDVVAVSAVTIGGPHAAPIPETACRCVHDYRTNAKKLGAEAAPTAAKAHNRIDQKVIDQAG
jgi:hypothetical protein